VDRSASTPPSSRKAAYTLLLPGASRSFLPIRGARGRQIVGTPVFIMRVHRPFGMIGGIFRTLDPRSFDGLVGVRQFLDALVVRILGRRKPLGAT